MLDMLDINTLNFDLNTNNRYMIDGKSVPRVTEIISKMIHEDKLMEWSNYLGFKREKYRTVLNEAADYGTKVHHGIEMYLKEDKVEEGAPFFSMSAFLAWYNLIRQNHKIKILGQEQKLMCQYYGGTYDLLLEIDGGIWLIDFKTSNHVTYKYYLQLAAYNKILKEMGVNITGCIILQLSKDTPQYREYILDLRIPEHKAYFDICERTFISLLYGYYHIHYLEGEFNYVSKPTK